MPSMCDWDMKWQAVRDIRIRFPSRDKVRLILSESHIPLRSYGFHHQSRLRPLAFFPICLLRVVTNWSLSSCATNFNVLPCPSWCYQLTLISNVFVSFVAGLNVASVDGQDMCDITYNIHAVIQRSAFFVDICTHLLLWWMHNRLLIMSIRISVVFRLFAILISSWFLILMDRPRGSFWMVWCRSLSVTSQHPLRPYSCTWMRAC